MYKLTIIKTERNEDYEADIKRFKEDRSYGTAFGRLDDIPRPELEKNVKTLEVVLTDEQFEAVKKSVLETFK